MGSGGYHYMKLEITYDTINQFYNCHTGPTMGSDYSFNVELPLILIRMILKVLCKYNYERK